MSVHNFYHFNNLVILKHLSIAKENIVKDKCSGFFISVSCLFGNVQKPPGRFFNIKRAVGHKKEITIAKLVGIQDGAGIFFGKSNSSYL